MESVAKSSLVLMENTLLSVKAIMASASINQKPIRLNIYKYIFLVLVFKAPGLVTGTHNAFEMERVFHAAYDETTCLNWSSDSKLLAVGAKDMATKLYSFER